MALVANPDGTGNSLFVDPTAANDLGDGSYLTPKKTVPGAVTAAASGDVIFLRSATHTLAAAVDTSKSLKFVGLGFGSTIVPNGTSLLGPFTGSQRIEFHNLTITNNDGNCLASDAAYTVLKYVNAISSVGASDTVVIEGPSEDGTDGEALVENCRVISAGADGITLECRKAIVKNSSFVSTQTGDGETIPFMFFGTELLIAENVLASIISSGTNTANAIAALLFGRCILNNCMFEARQTNAGATGGAYGIRSGGYRTTDNDTPIYVAMNGGRIMSQNSGHGVCFDLLGGSQIDATLSQVGYAANRMSGSKIVDLALKNGIWRRG